MEAFTRRFLKNQRLSKPSDFRSVFNTKVRSVDSRFLVLARDNGLTYSRLGLAVSKEKVRKAVSRNSIKRLIRESFRVNHDILTGLDLVVVPQGRLDATDRRQLRESLNLHWRKVATCKKSSSI